MTGGGAGGFGAWLFRYRGWVPVPAIAFALIAADPTRAGLIAGLGLMAAGEAVRLWGAAHLGRTARSSRPLATKLVTRGPYALTRHPLYWGNFALTTGFALASGAGLPWFPVLAAALFALLYGGHARREEAALAAAFPELWDVYRRRVPAWRWRLRPARSPAGGEPGEPSLRRAFGVEALTLNAEFWLLAALWFRGRLGG